jgi:HTH-type transcriptional regulator/antitoxin HigA
MNWKILKSEEDYILASQRLIELFEAENSTEEEDELALLVLLIADYDAKNYVFKEIDVLEVIKSKMEEQGLKAKDLEPLIGSKGHVSAVLSGKREITLKMAKKLKEFFSLPAELFLQHG